MHTRAAILALLLATPVVAQNPAPPPPPSPASPRQAAPPKARELRPPVADSGIFSPLALPPANDIRRANGAPGPKYWQQRADYTIRASLDTALKRLTGQASIRYTNNSPDTLERIWLQLDQNLFRKGSVGSYLNAEDTRFGAEGFDGGYHISAVTQSQPAARGRPASKPSALRTRVDDTMMEVFLAAPLPPGGVTLLDIAYAFSIPEHGSDRMGRDGALYELAQWYPRVAVYDDVHGWNTLQYLGQGEFYLEYGDFTYEVTVPAGYIVGGTGTLQNPLEVLTATQRARLKAAASSDTAVRIVTAEELASGAARPKREGTLTWKFKAQNVRDVAWAGSPDYQWDVAAWEGLLSHAYYRPAAAATWHEAAVMGRFSLQEYSTRWFRYPYPQVSAVEGPVSGMEYPMVTMENGDSREGFFAVLTHETGHMWYPMVVGSDERRYAWMDEGFNTFINTFAESGYFQRDDSARRKGEAAFTLMNDQAPTAQPIMTYANRYRTEGNLGTLAYIKPAIGLSLLRSKILGEETFDLAFREYTRRWAFRHPQPADFFRTIEDVSGRDLDWFWRGWFFTTGALDQAIDSVTQRPDPKGGHRVVVTFRNAGYLVMPVDLRLTLSDGSAVTATYPVEIWYKGDKYTATLTTAQPVVAATVNPDGLYPDVVPANNGWKVPN